MSISQTPTKVRLYICSSATTLLICLTLWKMALRVCVYKSCENYINLKDRAITDVKLFSFPKNPERRQKWIELGKVHPNIPESKYYFCSDHFDKKYLAVNNRRTALVGEAFPFPYVETEAVETNVDDELDYYLYEMSKVKNEAEKTEHLDHQDLLVESTTITTTEFQEFSDNLYEEERTDDVIMYTGGDTHNQEYTINYDNKRKLDNTILQVASSKSKVLKTSPAHTPLRKSFEKTNAKSSDQLSIQSNLNQVSSQETKEEYIDADKLVDAQHVTTFIFKGEEYVQMPKEHYINEKTDMMKKLKNMETTLKAIKGILESLDV